MESENLNLSSHDKIRLIDRLWHPKDVVSSPGLSTAEKRTVLAEWASDLRAVLGAPTLRQLDNGAVISLDTILKALRALDGVKDNQGPIAYPGQPHDDILTKWRKRTPWRRRKRDDDEDPPPLPLAMPARDLIPARA